MLRRGKMKNECSNCKFSRIRRMKVWCSQDQSRKSLSFCCVDYKPGFQTIISDSNGVQIYPKISIEK